MKPIDYNGSYNVSMTLKGLKMHDTYNFNQKFYSVEISVHTDIRKIFKKSNILNMQRTLISDNYNAE